MNFLLRGRSADDITLPRVAIPKTSARCMGGIFSDGTPVWGAGPLRVVSIDCNQVRRLFFSPVESELLPVLGVRLVKRLEH